MGEKIPTLVLFLCIFSAAVTAEYVRPQPRETLDFPWDRKPSSYPQQVHISLAGEGHKCISWVTDGKSSPSYVEYGTSPGRYDSTAQGESTSYSYLFYSSGKIHHTVIGPLESNTVYFYRCGGEGPEFRLKTPPAEFPVAFAVAVDLCQTGWTKSTLDYIDQCNARPWMVTLGNHKMESIPLIKDGFQSYNARWKMPLEQSGLNLNLYYSSEVAGFHVIMLGSYTTMMTTQITILHQGEGDGMKQAMEPLLYASGVDMVFAGSVHAYERSKRVNTGQPDPCGAVHVSVGNGGNKRCKNPQPEWSVFREASFGHGELKLVNSTHAFWSWHRNDDDEPVRSDQLRITSLESSGCLAEKKHYLRKIFMAPWYWRYGILMPWPIQD
ncbi:hypothetical protein EUGRSUZ_F00882 [Eucalyptus grandis]|uniref:Uncharacterized protein n=2 Tax=Eucalyptus grandis TaxID=71139 RepID=A0ACC3KDC2_EUCGR|nr:hypothetical protein EUGRSUZ_F00882 [Eucalyptus grandis]